MRFSRSAYLRICFYLETLASNIRTSEPIQVKLTYLVNFVIIFQITSNDLTQMFNFLTWIPDSDSHSPAYLDLFLSSNASICSAIDFHSLENSDHVVVSVSIFFLLNSKRDAPFHCIAYDCSRADRDSLCDHLREVPWEYIFKVSVSAAASNFSKWFQVRIDVYIPHRKYHVKSHTSPWFSAACTAAIVHRNHIFHLYKQNKYSESKVKFRQSSSCYKRVLQAVKLAYVNKTRVLHFPETWLSGILANCQ